MTTWNYGAFKAPTEGGFAGRQRFKPEKTPYELFIEDEGVPLYTGGGIRDVRELDLKPWPRLETRGAYIQLDGTKDDWGMYVVEVPGARALPPQRHMYECIMQVVEGRGTTEIWLDEQGTSTTFEWQAGSLFAIPLNAHYKLVNATRDRALIIAATTAPPVFDIFVNRDFIFKNDFVFTDRYYGQGGYFENNRDLQPDPIRGRAMIVTSYIPDVATCELPLDNQRSPGYRRIEPHMAGNNFGMFVGEHEVGRYAKAHYHTSGAVLVCLKGAGYTYNWPVTLGPHPWKDGHGDQVRREDYVPGGMVAAAPGGGDWFHQHFGIGQEPLRYLALIHRERADVQPEHGSEEAVNFNLDLSLGGKAIDYPNEDPQIRESYEFELSKAGLKSRMPAEVYQELARP